MKLSQKQYILVGAILVVIATIALVLYITFVKLDTTTDGTEDYSGVKLQAAQAALEQDQGAYSPAMFHSQAKPHVESVKPTPEGKGDRGNELKCTNDPHTIQYYSVTIRRIWLFGSTYGEREYNLCNIIAG